MASPEPDVARKAPSVTGVFDGPSPPYRSHHRLIRVHERLKGERLEADRKRTELVCDGNGLLQPVQVVLRTPNDALVFRSRHIIRRGYGKERRRIARTANGERDISPTREPFTTVQTPEHTTGNWVFDALLMAPVGSKTAGERESRISRLGECDLGCPRSTYCWTHGSRTAERVPPLIPPGRSRSSLQRDSGALP